MAKWVIGVFVVALAIIAVENKTNFHGGPDWVPNVVVFGAIGIWFVYEIGKGIRKDRRQRASRRVEQAMRSAGMPDNYGLCRWDDCVLPMPHGHSRNDLFRRSNAAVWRDIGEDPPWFAAGFPSS